MSKYGAKKDVFTSILKMVRIKFERPGRDKNLDGMLTRNIDNIETNAPRSDSRRFTSSTL